MRSHDYLKLKISFWSTVRRLYNLVFTYLNFLTRECSPSPGESEMKCFLQKVYNNVQTTRHF